MAMSENKERMTNIQISEETWKKLNSIKKLGETMNNVVERLLKECN